MILRSPELRLEGLDPRTQVGDFVRQTRVPRSDRGSSSTCEPLQAPEHSTGLEQKPSATGRWQRETQPISSQRTGRPSRYDFQAASPITSGARPSAAETGDGPPLVT